MVTVSGIRSPIVCYFLQVWLKFNDNTVSEVTWEELVKESVGGTSNTSAYSLVYIDASKPELLMDSHDKMAQTEEGNVIRSSIVQ